MASISTRACLGFDVENRLLGLFLYVGGHFAGSGIDGQLTRYKYHVAGLNSLAVRAYGARCLIAYDFLFHIIRLGV